MISIDPRLVLWQSAPMSFRTVKNVRMSRTTKNPPVRLEIINTLCFQSLETYTLTEERPVDKIYEDLVMKEEECTGLYGSLSGLIEYKAEAPSSE